MWDESSFLQSKAVATDSELKRIRLEAFEDTVRSVLSGGYLNDDNEYYHFDFTDNESILYDKKLEPLKSSKCNSTRVVVIQNDCLKESLKLKELGLNPILLNMANRKIPGFGLIQGGTQEDALFRRTTLFLSLYQFYKNYHKDCLPFLEEGTCKIEQQESQYPISENLGVIYSSGIYVFRDDEETGYRYLNSPSQISIMSTAGIFRPKLTDNNRLNAFDENRLSEKIRTIFRIAIMHNHDSMVLGALGCGAFANPPEHVAEIFHRILNEEEFRNQFVEIVFAIIDDKNTYREHNPNGNFLPFYKEFNF